MAWIYTEQPNNPYLEKGDIICEEWDIRTNTAVNEAIVLDHTEDGIRVRFANGKESIWSYKTWKRLGNTKL